ncbi:MAG: hypothetical protein ACJ8GW_13675 [Massilia sp.]
MSKHISDKEAEVIVAIEEEGREAKASLAELSGIRDFGDNEATIRYLDQFIDQLRAAGVAEDLEADTQMLACLLGDLLVAKFAGRWRAVRDYYVELKSATGAVRLAFPFAVVRDRLSKDGAVSLFDFYFQKLPAQLGHAVRANTAAPEHPLMETIRKNATFVIQYIGHKNGLREFGLNAASIPYLDIFIDQNVGEDTSEAVKEKYRNLLGAFLGECIVAHYGAEWKVDRKGMASLVVMSKSGELNILDPFGKLGKRIANGNVDNLSVYFQEFIPYVISSDR